jgi:hypothetical protein
MQHASYGCSTDTVLTGWHAAMYQCMRVLLALQVIVCAELQVKHLF